MKKYILLLLTLLLAAAGFTPALAEDITISPALRVEDAVATPVAQDTYRQFEEDTYDTTLTSYEVTVPIHLPVTWRTEQADGIVQELTLTPAVAQVTYFKGTFFDGTHLCGGIIDPLNYPKLSYLGVPPYPGGPFLPTGILPTDILYDVDFAITERTYGGGMRSENTGQMVTVTYYGGTFTITYPSTIIVDSKGEIIDTERTTVTVPSDFAYTFHVTAPEYTGELDLPTFEEWMGVPRTIIPY